MLLLALALFAAAVGVGIYTVASSADEKATVRASLRQLDGYLAGLGLLAGGAPPAVR